jgi:putative salt-induced outer membrane protein YdiY
MKYCAHLAILLALFSPPLRGGVVEFKNGDRLTGTVQRVVGSKLTLKTEMIGDVSIPVEKMKSFSGGKTAVVLVKDGRAFNGELSLLESGEWELKKNGGARRVEADSVEAIYPAATYQPEVEGRHEVPWRNWKGKGNVGYSLVRGDRDASTLSVGFNATRRQPDLPGLKEKLRTNFFLNMLFANTRTDGIQTSANSISSGMRQDFLITSNNFVFVLAQLDHIQTQSLNLRQTYGGGLGHDIIRNRRVVLNFLSGVTFVRENFQTDVNRTNAEALIGERLSLNLTQHMSFEHYLNFYPNLTDRGEYRIDTTSSLNTRLSSLFSFNTTLTNRVLSNPLPGRQKHELVLTTGLGISF